MQVFIANQFPSTPEAYSPLAIAITQAGERILQAVPIEGVVLDDPNMSSRIQAFDTNTAGRINTAFPSYQAGLIKGTHMGFKPSRLSIDEGLVEAMAVQSVEDDTSDVDLVAHRIRPSKPITKRQTKTAELFRKIIDRSHAAEDAYALCAMEISQDFTTMRRGLRFPVENSEGQQFSVLVEQAAMGGEVVLRDEVYQFDLGHLAIGMTFSQIKDEKVVSSHYYSTTNGQIGGRTFLGVPLLPGQGHAGIAAVNGDTFLPMLEAIADHQAAV